jgi:hypothetical protein
MKIWSGYGSEHSMNLVLIGKFKQARDAENVKSLLDKIADQASKDEAYSISHSPPENQRFSEEMLSLLRAHKLHTLSPIDLEQFALEHHIDQENDSITVMTDEVDVSAFIKIFLDAGARVEVYSAHDYPEEQSEEN